MNERTKYIFPKLRVCCDIVATVAIAVQLASCTPEVENVFGESAANRMEQSQLSYYDILESQQQGWAVDFYPSDRSLGGVAYTARFHDGEATMSCELPIANTVTATTYPVGTEVSSLYQITDETGIILTFDTYNPLFHYWSQPFSGRAKGYESDYEFIFLSASPDSVVLRGKKYGNLLKMYPLQEDAVTYITKVEQMHTLLSATIRKRAVVDGTNVHVTMGYNLFTYGDGDDSHIQSFIHTDRGIRFYEPVTFSGATVSQLTFNGDADELRSPDGRIVLPKPTVAELFAGGSTQWYFNYTSNGGVADVCPELAEIITENAKKVKAPDWGYEVLKDIYIGSNLRSGDTSHTVIGWRTQGNYGNGEAGYFGYAVGMNLVDDERQLLTIQPLAATEGFGQHAYCQTMVDFIAAGSPYLLTFDDDQNPTAVTLTSEADSSRWLKLSKK